VGRWSPFSITAPVPFGCTRPVVTFGAVPDVERTQGAAMTARAAIRTLVVGCAAVATGNAAALGIWRSCYHQSDITRFWGQVGLIALVIVAGAALGALRPSRLALLDVLVLAGLTAVPAYLWLVENTAATRCAWYQESGPGGLSRPQSVVSSADRSR
jgi:hypothetical protein